MHNYRIALRITTFLALGILLFYTLGLVLWIIDEFLRWNILPNRIERYARIIITVFGGAVLLLLIAIHMLSMTLPVEAAAEQASLGNNKPPAKLKRIAGLTVVAFAVLVGGQQTVDVYRKNAAAAEADRKQARLTEQRRATFLWYKGETVVLAAVYATPDVELERIRNAKKISHSGPDSPGH